uniref:Uncharacterized protein n=1 Tax=Kalmanozyma brasiliensis (strain GHG001) TaxID=1365824 RepID=V5F2X0_KALBG
MSLIWGALAELIGLAAVTSTSYLFIAVGLVAYTLPRKPWPDLVPARLVFAIGGSGATAMLSGILSEYSGSTTAQSWEEEEGAEVIRSAGRDPETTSDGTLRPPSRPLLAEEGVEAEETDRLLASDEQESNGISPLATQKSGRSRHGRVAAIAGVFTGLGALIAVFVLH